jgi:hypothetical protein
VREVIVDTSDGKMRPENSVLKVAKNLEGNSAKKVSSFFATLALRQKGVDRE